VSIDVAVFQNEGDTCQFSLFAPKCNSLPITIAMSLEQSQFPKQHTQPFYGSVDFVWDNLGEPVPEETFTRSHSSWSSISIYYDPWHPPSSIHVLYSLFPQSLSKFSLVYLLALHPPLHTPLHTQSLSSFAHMPIPLQSSTPTCVPILKLWWRSVQACKLNRKDAVGRSEEADEGQLMIRIGVSGWMFLLTPVHLGSPRQRP